MSIAVAANEPEAAERDSAIREHTQLTCPKCGHVGELLHIAGDDMHMRDTVTNFIQMPCSGIPPHRILICPKCNTALDPLDPQGRTHRRRNSDA